MKTKFAIITSMFLLLGCRTKSEVVQAIASERHTDSVAVVSSVNSSVTTREQSTEAVAMREQVWETIVMRPDTTGELRVVARDIVRHTDTSAASTQSSDNATESVQSGDTAVFVSETIEDTIQVTKTQQTAKNEPRRGLVGFMLGLWVAFAALVGLLALYLYAKWKR